MDSLLFQSRRERCYWCQSVIPLKAHWNCSIPLLLIWGEFTIDLFFLLQLSFPRWMNAAVKTSLLLRNWHQRLTFTIMFHITYRSRGLQRYFFNTLTTEFQNNRYVECNNSDLLIEASVHTWIKPGHEAFQPSLLLLLSAFFAFIIFIKIPCQHLCPQFTSCISPHKLCKQNFLLFDPPSSASPPFSLSSFLY